MPGDERQHGENADQATAHSHDDNESLVRLISAALRAILDQQDWPGTGSAEINRMSSPREHRLDSVGALDKAHKIMYNVGIRHIEW